MKRKMRIEIGTSLYTALINAVTYKNPFLYEGQPHNIDDVKRIERTDFVEVELSQC